MVGTRRLADFNANPGSFMQGEEEDEGPDGFADFGGGTVLPVKNGKVQFPRAGRAARPASTGGAGMFGTLASPDDQYRMSQGMSGKAMSDIQRENDSRVSQRREMRRMAHEQQLAAMRMQSENARANADREAMLIRELLSGM